MVGRRITYLTFSDDCMISESQPNQTRTIAVERVSQSIQICRATPTLGHITYYILHGVPTRVAGKVNLHLHIHHKLNPVTAVRSRFASAYRTILAMCLIVCFCVGGKGYSQGESKVKQLKRASSPQLPPVVPPTILSPPSSSTPTPPHAGLTISAWHSFFLHSLRNIPLKPVFMRSTSYAAPR